MIFLTSSKRLTTNPNLYIFPSNFFIPLLEYFVHLHSGNKRQYRQILSRPEKEFDPYLQKIGGDLDAIFGRFEVLGHLKCRLFFQPRDSTFFGVRARLADPCDPCCHKWHGKQPKCKPHRVEITK